MEALSSTSPLMIAAARDMDLLACIDYFLDRCVNDEGQIAKRFVEMPVGRLLRGGCNQHTIGPGDMPALRWKAEKCLEVCVGSLVRWFGVLGWVGVHGERGSVWVIATVGVSVTCM